MNPAFLKPSKPLKRPKFKALGKFLHLAEVLQAIHI
jgi:hypothetical protein